MAGATSATTSINLAARNMKAIGKSLFCYFFDENGRFQV